MYSSPDNLRDSRTISLWNKTVVLCLIAIGFFFSYSIVRISLSQPDTCFLLALGRWIVEHGKLPTIDPFSYTMGAYENFANGIVFHQWLCEVVFYILYKIGGTANLLMAVTLIFLYTFFIVPARIFADLQVNNKTSFLFCLFVALAAGCRMYARPEIFSELFVAIFLQISVVERIRRQSLTKVDWRTVGLFAVGMLLWANFHAGFVVGIFILFALAGADLILQFLKDKKIDWSTYSASALICTLCSFVNPQGFALWRDLPILYFHPINKITHEYQTLSLLEFKQPQLWGFAILSIAFVYVAIKYFRQKRSYGFEYIVPGFAAIFAGLLVSRIMSISILILTVSFAFLLPKSSNNQEGYFEWRSWRSLFMLMTVTIILTMVFAQIYLPTIPSSSAAYIPPFSAIKYLGAHPPNGNLLNDPEAGDVIMWSIQNPPKVFIDTRFGFYRPKIAYDYLTMSQRANDWRELLKSYDIKEVFLPAGIVLSKELAQSKDWQLLYSDSQSTILSKIK